CLQYNSAPFTF
nr:immunoglobulin light chain junction region [Macaca mulatta]MOW61722.1 immunoglobulin light chain junction region [Macaca mulatta]MOW61837.1 immunoglobulin light chain junction region [Macaca mulatta]MOW62117.1 immunoglobulin light chain junction region [Macaca mulatta]MOW62209.1 immunoglobulin light chain junction region [Macaca mulatta]